MRAVDERGMLAQAVHLLSYFPRRRQHVSGLPYSSNFTMLIFQVFDRSEPSYREERYIPVLPNMIVGAKIALRRGTTRSVFANSRWRTVTFYSPTSSRDNPRSEHSYPETP